MKADLFNYFMLPNLELLDWMDSDCLPQSFFNNLAIVGLSYSVKANWVPVPILAARRLPGSGLLTSR